MNEAKVTENDVRDEHLQSVNVPAHWGYLVGVLVGGFVLMIGLIALIGGAGG